MEKTNLQENTKRKRLDKWLGEAYPMLTKRHIREAVEARLVVGLRREVLKKGTLIEHIPNTSSLDAHLEVLGLGNAQLGPINVIYENERFLVIDKPAGTASHPLSLFDMDTVTHWAFARDLKIRRAFKSYIQPTLCPHRLDTDTSGLLIVCCDTKEFEVWRKAFAQKRIEKYYLAWCWGVPSKKSWTNEEPIAHSKETPSKMTVVTKQDQSCRPPILAACTSFRVISQRADRFLVEARMKTGVTHQVRVHLSTSGFPLVGDKLYDPRWDFREDKVEKHLLRANKLEAQLDGGREYKFQANTKAFEATF